MFNPNEGSLSTGEPPTAPSDSTSAQTILTSGSASQQETSNLSFSSSSSRSLSVQEPDSGYEASPSSVAEDNQRFFGASNNTRQSEICQTSVHDEDFDCTQILFSDSESIDLEDYDTCVSPVSCSCFRTDSSTTNATAISNCDSNSSDSSSNRPSSLPIQIPILPSCRIASDFNNRVVIGSPRGISSLPRDISSLPVISQPTNPLYRLGLIPRHPLSWPSTESPLSNPTNIHMNICRRHNHPVRSRRQIIDSDCSSSFSSSDDEGPEDVFNMPSGEASSYPTMMTMSSVPLPDVVLESTETGRRSRSLSVNLPPDRERALNDIGQRLRRLSDLFEQGRQFRMAVMRARSRTVSECDNHRHRNGLS